MSLYLEFLFEMFCVKISCFKQFDLRGRIEQTRPYMGPKVFMNMVKAIGVRVNIEYIHTYIYYNA